MKSSSVFPSNPSPASSSKSTSLFSSRKVRIVVILLVAACLYLTYDAFRSGYQEGKKMREEMNLGK